ncbi:MFS transporter [soil metagenome]
MTSLVLARAATRAQFFCLGGIYGTWGVHVPTIKAHYRLDEASLSFALLAVAGGAVFALLRAGALVSRIGARAGAIASGMVMCAALGVLLASDSYALLIAAALVLGASSAVFDVSINTEGAALEALGTRKVMSGFHGMFSLGGMAAAGVGAWVIGAGISADVHLMVAAACLAPTVVLAGTFMLPAHSAHDAGLAPSAAGETSATEPQPQPQPQPPSQGSAADRPTSAARQARRRLLLLGLLGAAGLEAEGAMYDWSVLYLDQNLGAAPALAALAYGSFSAAMAAGRFAGDALRTRFDGATVLGGGAMLAACAMTAVLLIGHPMVALIGFAIVGLGLANVVPVLFVAATEVPGVAASAGIARVSSLGYLGFLLGPPMVGGLAHATSLPIALSVVVLALLLLAWGARRLAPRPVLKPVTS